MRLWAKIMGTATAVIAMLILTASSDNEDRITRRFDNIKSIKIKTLSGDCIIEKGHAGEVTVDVVNQYSPRSSCKTIIKYDEETLEFIEEITGTGRGGSTVWTLNVPDGIEVEFFSTSGGISLSNAKGKFSANSASGGYELTNCEGEFAFNTASGNYDIENCRGKFEISSASGNIYAVGLVIDANSSLASASGSVNIRLGRTPEYDLNIGSASGNAVLDYGGNPLLGRFEFEAKDRGGEIDSPFDFDNEETFYKHDQRYVRKWFVKGPDEPEITIGTSSGRAVLKK